MILKIFKGKILPDGICMDFTGNGTFRGRDKRIDYNILTEVNVLFVTYFI
jgi:hypothetical protein